MNWIRHTHEQRNLLNIIQQADRDELVELNLSRMNLTEIPQEICQLKKLRSLDLSNNDVAELPTEFRSLTKLKKLNLSSNNLVKIPTPLCELTHLEKLDVSRNQLTTLPRELCKNHKLTELYLSKNQITTVAKEIEQLNSLTRLSLDQNQLTSLPRELGKLVGLTELFLAQNQLKMLPEEFGQLTNLAVLYLYQNQLKVLPAELGQLTNLTVLYLHQNSLTTIPEALGRLVNLKELYLDQNKISFLPKELGNLNNLTELSLNQNQLTAVPKELGRLSRLTELHLDQNELTVLPNELSQLCHLTQLSLTQNRLTIISKKLCQLPDLIELRLSGNQLASLPEELGKLNKLQRIDLSNNNLMALPDFLGQLPGLELLLLHGNEKLAIPNEILGATLEEIRNGATPANPQNILSYYSRTLTNYQPLNEAKLILVGFGDVGKTSLVNRLVHQTFNSKSKKTEGIQITPWPIRLNDVEDITLNVWDFGGQEIMHSTHQFFLTERSLYLLVLSGRQGHEDTDAEYWLDLIRSFGGNSPVIVVLNKIREHPFAVNRRALQDKFKSIKEFVQTDCKAGIGLAHLRSSIERETDQLEHLRAAFPASWVSIKNQLTGMDGNYISFEKYREICRKDGETDAAAQEDLALYLHSLGVALNYKDDPRLRDTHILNPHWVTKGIYDLLNARRLSDERGELEIAYLSDILDADNYPLERHEFLLELMRKFELCFRFQEDEARYLIPDLLDKQQPFEAASFDSSECLNFRYQYSSLPEGLLPRFIVRTHVLSQQELRWRTGVILTFDGNRALVKADRQDRSISISVDGSVLSRRRLLAVIRADFERIHSSFKFQLEELVPVPGYPAVRVSYEELVAREKGGERSFTVFYNGSLHELLVQDLLNGVDIEGSRQNLLNIAESDIALRLFYSYSHKDENFREQLENHLKILERQHLIQQWYDKRILPGGEWATEIDENLNQADIILLLISADFIASEYCYTKELQRAMERHRDGEATVIPIFLRAADCDGTPFNDLQRLPSGARTVDQWSNRDAAWLNVEEGIKRAIQSIKTRR